jgi:hypothetical protein
MNNHELIAKFQEVCIKHYESDRVGHAYANGYLGSIVGQLLEVVPQAEKAKFRRYFEKSIEEMSRSPEKETK